jgi:hypothetical protein
MGPEMTLNGDRQQRLFAILMAQCLIGVAFILIVYRWTNPERILGILVLCCLLAFVGAATALADAHFPDASRRAGRALLVAGPVARRMTRRLALAGVLVALLLVATLVLQRFPNSADEYAYLFQADTLQALRLWNEVHPLQEFFTFSHIAEQDGKWVGRFPPGWPLVLAIFNAAYIPYWAVNPILGCVTLALLWRFAAVEYGRRVAGLTALGFGLSGFFVFNAASYFSHTISGLLLVVFTYWGCRYLEAPRWTYAAVIGAAAAGLAITRYYTAALCALPFAVALLRTWSLRHWLGGVVMIAAGAPLIAFLLFYNERITGDPLLFVTRWHDPGEMIGFNRGYSVWDVPQRIGRWATDYAYYASPLMLVLWIWAVLRARDGALRFFDFYFPLLLAGYLFWYSDGANRYGPRFLYAAWPFMALRIGIAVEGALRGQPAAGAARLLPFLFLLHLWMSMVNLPVNAVRNHEIIYERRDLFRAVEQAGLSDALVFVSSGTGLLNPMRPMDLLFNSIAPDGEVVYAHHRPGQAESLLAHFPGRSVWVYDRPEGAVRGTLTPLDQRDEAP